MGGRVHSPESAPGFPGDRGVPCFAGLGSPHRVCFAAILCVAPPADGAAGGGSGCPCSSSSEVAAFWSSVISMCFGGIPYSMCMGGFSGWHTSSSPGRSLPQGEMYAPPPVSFTGPTRVLGWLPFPPSWRVILRGIWQGSRSPGALGSPVVVLLAATRLVVRSGCGRRPHEADRVACHLRAFRRLQIQVR